jgi:transcriptional regulator with XRE-family HTH domain
MIGEAFRIVRVFNDMTQQELAEKLGISAGYLSQIESNKRTPTLETIKDFSKFFGIPASSLIFFSEQLGTGEGEKDRAARLAFGQRILGLLTKIDRMAQ